MKRYQDLIKGIGYVGQFGFTIVCPPIVMALLGVWLRDRFSLGGWIVPLFIVIGLLAAASSAYSFFRAIARIEDRRDKAAGYDRHKGYNRHQ